MQVNRATIILANNREMSGRPTADEISRSYRIGKERSLWRIGSFPFFGSLVMAGFFAAIPPLPVRGDEGEDSRHGHEDNDKGIRAELAALQAQVASLQDQVNSLQANNSELQSQLAAIQSNHALLLGPFVNVDHKTEIGVKGPNIIFSGANIHIVSGSGKTDDNRNATGLGNLIIGYDEDPATFVDNSPVNNLPLSQLNPDDRGGSHNLVIGAANRFTRATFGGVVVGTANTINGYGASVSGGAGNTAFFYGTSVSGGFSNLAAGYGASVSGGSFNVAGSTYSSVSGGSGNIAEGIGGFGQSASVSGGSGNIASGTNASICGGESNDAIDDNSTVAGGTGNTAGSQITFQGGIGAIVVGGSGNNAGGRNSVVIGAHNVIDNSDNSIAPQPPFP